MNIGDVQSDTSEIDVQSLGDIASECEEMDTQVNYFGNWTGKEDDEEEEIQVVEDDIFDTSQAAGDVESDNFTIMSEESGGSDSSLGSGSNGSRSSSQS